LKSRRGTSQGVVIGAMVVIVILVGAGAFYAGQASVSRGTTITSTVTASAGAGNSADQALYQLALKDGSVTVYGTIDSDQFAFYVSAFNVVYPGITVNYVSVSPSQAYTRITSEIAASGHSADMITIDGLAPSLQAAGDIIPYVAPGAADYPQAALDHTNATTAITNLPQGCVYNTKLVPASQVPKTLSDLTNPQWKGKMAMHDPTLGTGGTHYWATLSTVMGNSTINNFLTQLKANVNPTLMPSPGGTESAVASGQFAIACEVFLTDTVGDILNNATVAPLPLQGVPLVTSPSVGAILKGAQHENAAKLLIDFLASPAGQAVVGDVTNIIPTSAPRIPINPNVQVPYSMNSLISKYDPGANVTYVPASILLNSSSYQATYKSIFG
jgi:iron(III) transport system substrate-binding protein